MNKRAARVLNGAFELDPSERQEVLDALQREQRMMKEGRLQEAKHFHQEIRAEIGPLGGASCPCCGR